MANPNDLVQITIKVQDSAASVPSFSTILILAGHLHDEGMKSYAPGPDGLSAMVTDGFNVNEAAYKIAAIIGMQTPTTDKIKIWKRSALAVQTVTLTPTVTTEGFTYAFTIRDSSGNSQEITHTNGESETATTICTAISTALTEILGVTETVGTGVLTLTATTGSFKFWIENPSRELTIKETSIDAGVATDLAAAAVADPDFYGVLIDSSAATEIAAAAAWCEANGRLFLGVTQDSGCASSDVTNDILSTLKTAGYNKTGCFFTRNPQGFPNAALMARQFALTPGSSTWANKKLAGASFDNLTESEIAALKAKNGMFYAQVKGLPLTQQGKAASGRFVDITHGLDYFSANLQSELLTLMANVEKIPYTSAGVAQADLVIRTRMQLTEDAVFFKSGWTVTPPDLSKATTIQRNTRVLPDFTFKAELAGAAHKIVVSGTVGA